MHILLFSAIALLCSITAKSQAPFEGDSTLMVFASDTQKPMWVETLFLKSNQNRQATQKIFNEFGQVRPKALFLLGDVVNLGYSNRQWKDMGTYIKTLRNQGIEVHAALGNHEVMGRARKGENKFQTYFPEHVRTGFVKVVDSVAVILLNSNFGKLTAADNEKQLKWYKQTLKELDNDPSIEYVITGCHHSPFTNSKIVGCSKGVEDKFVQPFLSSAKSRLFLSGHSHNFEQYQVQGKDFLVIGGGGGLHQPLKTGDGILPDIAADYKPEFHYLTVKRCAAGLELKSYALTKDFTGFEEGRSMVILKETKLLPDENATVGAHR